MKQTIFCEKLFKDFSSHFEPYLPDVGLTLAQVQKANVEIPERKFVELLEIIAENEHPHIGLDIANKLQPEHIGALGHAVINAKDVEQAIETIVGFVITYSHFANIQCLIKAKTVEISYQISDPTILNKRQDSEFAIIAIHRMLCLCAEKAIPLIATYFEHIKPDKTDCYKGILDCPIHFSANTSKLVYSKDVLKYKAPNRDERLYDILTQHLKEERKRRDSNELESQLSCLIASQLSSGNVSIAHTSKLLGISVRTLQRRLDENELDYSFILDRLRYQLAKNYLQDVTLTLSQISQKLGYNESSSFSRAFKRWADVSPKQYRKSINQHNKLE